MKTRLCVEITYPNGYSEWVSTTWDNVITTQTTRRIIRSIHENFTKGEPCSFHVGHYLINLQQVAVIKVWMEKRFFGFPIRVKI